jgi:hypothetical protein
MSDQIEQPVKMSVDDAAALVPELDRQIDVLANNLANLRTEFDAALARGAEKGRALDQLAQRVAALEARAEGVTFPVAGTVDSSTGVVSVGEALRTPADANYPDTIDNEFDIERKPGADTPNA